MLPFQQQVQIENKNPQGAVTAVLDPTPRVGYVAMVDALVVSCMGLNGGGTNGFTWLVAKSSNPNTPLSSGSAAQGVGSAGQVILDNQNLSKPVLLLPGENLAITFTETNPAAAHDIALIVTAFGTMNHAPRRNEL